MVQNTSPNTNQKKLCQVTVAHVCNPRYSRGRDQEDHSSKLQRPYLEKKPTTAGQWQLTPVILTTQEAEIRKISV
jgi:hypothetical protein